MGDSPPSAGSAARRPSNPLPCYFPESEFNNPVSSLPPNNLRAMYDELLSACPLASKPKLVAVFRELIHTRAVLCTSIDKRIEESQAKQWESWAKEPRKASEVG
jgi:hypothetical protein